VQNVILFATHQSESPEGALVLMLILIINVQFSLQLLVQFSLHLLLQ